ncbi:MAG: AbrB/MazE/SpoVT family DNA-binding domain-containing protein [Candidatus Levybacteria bacterium]|nr:AbrB/MazE/SpoVT family DNA-binding domain-containing protein [Candidatus Levybacteria bacterium]
MTQANVSSNQEWLKVLGKGMVTIPKKWREVLGIATGDIVRARKEGNQVVIETQKGSNVPYRIYSDSEIEEFLKEDKLPRPLTKKLRKKFA